jgi:hypothetical protein
MKTRNPPHSDSVLRHWAAGARRLASGAVLLLPWLLPAVALADDSTVRPDGRLQGYSMGVTLPEPGGYSFVWLELIVLGVLVALVLFKNAKRTHLD